MTKSKKPFLIAEIGINHNGSIKIAKKLIDLAAKYNFDAVKFQKRNPDVSVPSSAKDKMRPTPWGDMTYLSYKKKIEFGIKEFKEIDRYCKKKKIHWFASPWDVESNNFLNKFNLKYNKVASAMLTNVPLLESISKSKRMTFISTGMSNLSDISRAIKIFKKNKCKFALMHCVSAYPCPVENLNLKNIITLKKKFKCEVGYSGHESSVSPTLMAYSLGANIIERHITLDRSMWGTDQSASLSEQGILNLTSTIRKLYLAYGDGKKKLTKNDRDLLKKFKYWD